MKLQQTPRKRLKLSNRLKINIVLFVCICCSPFLFTQHKEEVGTVDRWTTTDRYWAAICVYHEARGEGMDAQIGVAHVIFNRAEHHGSDVVEEVFRPAQFSWANDGNRPPITEYHSLLMALLQVDECLKQRAAGDRFEGRVFFRDNSMSIP